MSDKIKILIVDDNAITVGMLHGLLKKDHIVETAITGTESLEKIPIFVPDIILLDLMLPDIDGYEICKTVRNSHLVSRPIVVIISAKSKLEDKQLAYHVGADDYIQKPFSNDELMAKIRAYSRLKRIEQQEKRNSHTLSSLSDQAKMLQATIAELTRSMADNSALSEEDQKNLKNIQSAGQELLKFTEAFR